MYENENYFDNINGNNTPDTANETQKQQDNPSGYNTYRMGNDIMGQYSGQSGYYGAGNNIPEIKKQKKPGFFQKLLLSISLGLFFGLFAGIGFYAVQYTADIMEKPEQEVNTSTSTATSGTNVVVEDNQSGIKLTNSNNITVVESDVSDVVEEVMPAMVSIINNYTITSQFWGQTFSEEENASGSGIIVAESDSELLIVSNNHVVEGADELMVTFIDGSEAEAHIKGLDADMDLAVIAVSLEELSDETKETISIATMGDSDDLKLGSPVIAIGNALGYGQSVTTGIVSALDREITFDDGSTGSFIQTDAAINPGNSGGALLNVNGEVIGINSSKIGGSVVEGMGYAIPITSASPIIADLMERQTRTDRVSDEEAGYMGISLQEVTADISQMYNMPKGIYVISVDEGSAAEKAGIMNGDIITKFDGDRITSYMELQNVLQYYAAGDSAKITIMRQENGQYVEYVLDITLGSRPVGR